MAYELTPRPGEPKMILAALEFLGVTEAAGTANNPTIIGWAKEVGLGLDKLYTADRIPWCGLFLAITAKRAGKTIPKSPLWAMNWQHFGTPLPEDDQNPVRGDVLIFLRHNKAGQLIGGHVGIYWGEDAECFHVLGGNQGDKVSILRIKKDRLWKARRPEFKTGRPAGAVRVWLEPTGEISTNEQ